MSNIQYINKSKITYIDDKKVLVKVRKIDIEKLYSYLLNRDFTNFVKPIAVNNSEEIYPFIETVDISDNDKAIDIIYLVSLLHSKTTKFESSNINKIKERYETTVNVLNDAYIYYSRLQDEIEEHIYMSPAEMLLMKNISKIYFMLNTSRAYLEEYYKEAETKSNERYVVVHGSLGLDHLIEGDEKYLISWNRARKDLPVYDLITFYKKDFDKIEIDSLYQNYQKKYKFTKEEKNLFFSLINVPEIIKLDNTNFIDTVMIRKLVDYMDKTISFTLEENKENKESNK